MKRYMPILNHISVSRVKEHIFDQEVEEWTEPYADMMACKGGTYVKFEDVERLLETLSAFPAPIAYNAVGIARLNLAQLRGEL